MHLPQTKPTLLVASLALALAALSGQAHALALSASAAWTLDGATGSGSPDVSTSTPVADVLASDYSATTESNIFYHVGGDAAGNYSARVSGGGVFDITGHWQSSTTFTNTLGAAASFDYGLFIENGELIVDLPDTAGGFGLAEYILTLSLNGSLLASSGGILSVDAGNTVSFSTSGFSLGGSYDASIAAYNWGSFTQEFALGTFAAGESFTIDVDLVTHASRDLLNDTCGFNGYGGVENVDIGLLAVGNGEGGGLCGATARFGDPPFIAGNPGTGSGGAVTGQLNPIPEPGTLALLGVGLAGAAALRRRKRR